MSRRRVHVHTVSPGEDYEATLTVEERDCVLASELLRRECRSARALASAALVAAVIACAGLVLVLLGNGRRSSAVSTVPLDSIQGFEVEREAPPKGTIDTSANGWYHVYLNTIVRKDCDLDSQRLSILTMGKRVYVTEKRGRRVRIARPMTGWMSLETADGIVILRFEAAPRSGDQNASSLDKAFQSHEVLRANARLQAEAAKFQHLEHGLLKSLRHLTGPEVLRGAKTLGFGGGRDWLGKAFKERRNVGTAVGHTIKETGRVIDKGMTQVLTAKKGAVEEDLSKGLGAEVVLPDIFPKVNVADVKKTVRQEGERFYGQVAKALAE